MKCGMKDGAAAQLALRIVSDGIDIVCGIVFEDNLKALLLKSTDSVTGHFEREEREQQIRQEEI